MIKLSSNSGKASQALKFLLPAVLLIVGLYLIPISIFHSDFSRFPGDQGDARFNNYILEHGYQFMTGQVDDFWDSPTMYPHKNVIAFSDNHLGTVPFYTLFRILGFDREHSYQLWFLFLFVLNFVCCFIALYRFSDHLILSSAGAYIFTFSVFILGTINHVQVFPRFMIPLVIYWMWQYLTTKQLKCLLFTCLGLVYQFYCGMYLGVLLIYVLFFLTASYFLVYRDWSFLRCFKKFKWSAGHLACIAGSALLLYPLLHPYLEANKEIYPLSYYDVLPSIPYVTSYFFASPAAATWTCLSETGFGSIPNWWAHYMFIGILPWIALVIAPFLLLRQNVSVDRKRIVTFVVTLVLCFIFCLNINGFSLYKYLFDLPGFSSMRSLDRLLNLEIFLFALIFVFVLAGLQKKFPFMQWIIFLTPALAIADNLILPEKVMTYSIQESRMQIDSLKQTILAQYDPKYKVIAVLPPAAEIDHMITNIDVMFAAQELRIPCVNVYTGYVPHYYIDFAIRGDEVGLKNWCRSENINPDSIQIIYAKDGKGPDVVYWNSIGGGTVRVGLGDAIIITEDTTAQPYFTFIDLGNNQCALKVNAATILCCEIENNAQIRASRSTISPWEIFTVVPMEDSSVALLAGNNKYLSWDSASLQIFANADSTNRATRFVFRKAE